MNGIAKFPSCSAFDTAPQSQSAVTSKCDGSCKWRSKASARGRLYDVEYTLEQPSIDVAVGGSLFSGSEGHKKVEEFILIPQCY